MCATISKEELVSIILSKQLQQRTPQEVCSCFNGVQAQFAGYPHQTIKIRSNPELFVQSQWQKELIRAWSIRGTMHVFPEKELPLYLHKDHPASLRATDNLKGDHILSNTRKERFSMIILEALDSGKKTRSQLKEICRNEGLTREEERSVFNSWGGLIRYLTDTGALVQTYGINAPYKRVKPFIPLPRTVAELEITRRYLSYYGPVSLQDMQYYFKRPKRELTNLLEQLSPEEVLYNGEIRFFLNEPDNISNRQAVHIMQRSYKIPNCVLLGGFDPLLLGYEKQASLFLDKEHIREVYTLTGIIKPAILYKGKIVGTWKYEKKNPLYSFFPTVTTQDTHAILQLLDHHL